MNSFATIHKVIGGLEFELEVEFKVHSFGSSPSYDDPGEGPEIEIVAITDTDTGRDLTKFCNEVRDWYGEPGTYGIGRLHHGVYTPAKWVRGVGSVATGPRQGICTFEHGYPMLDDAIYNEICVDHMPDNDFGPDDW